MRTCRFSQNVLLWDPNLVLTVSCKFEGKPGNKMTKTIITVGLITILVLLISYTSQSFSFDSTQSVLTIFKHNQLWEFWLGANIWYFIAWLHVLLKKVQKYHRWMYLVPGSDVAIWRLFLLQKFLVIWSSNHPPVMQTIRITG